MTLLGFQYTVRDMDKAIMANAISFTIAFSKRIKGLGKMAGPSLVNFPMEKFFW
jgi:hypothetical protein